MTAKQRILAILDEQPDDASFEDLLRELAFAQAMDRGISDSEAGRTVSHAELTERARSWE